MEISSLQNLLEGRQNCTDYVTVDCLRALYKIPSASSNLQLDPIAIVEISSLKYPGSYRQPDLNNFFDNFSSGQKQRVPSMVSINGGMITDRPGAGDNMESNLDLEYAMALVDPISVQLYQIDLEVSEEAWFFTDVRGPHNCWFELDGVSRYLDALFAPFHAGY